MPSCEIVARACGAQLGVALDRPHVVCEEREQRGVVAGAGADVEHAVLRGTARAARASARRPVAARSSARRRSAARRSRRPAGARAPGRTARAGSTAIAASTRSSSIAGRRRSASSEARVMSRLIVPVDGGYRRSDCGTTGLCQDGPMRLQRSLRSGALVVAADAERVRRGRTSARPAAHRHGAAAVRISAAVDDRAATARPLTRGRPRRLPGAAAARSLTTSTRPTAGASSPPVARRVRPLVYVPEQRQQHGVRDRPAHVPGRPDQFAVGELPQHVVPSYDLRTLWVTNDLGNSLTPINPVERRPGAPGAGRGSLQHVLQPGRPLRDRDGRAAAADRLPQSAHDAAASLARASRAAPGSTTPTSPRTGGTCSSAASSRRG